MAISSDSEFPAAFLELFPSLQRIPSSPANSRMTPTSVTTDSELLGLMVAGDEQALETLYNRRQGVIYRFSLQMSGSHALAEDVTQEVFMALIRGEVDYNPSRGSVIALMLGIARNHVLRRLRYQQSLVSFEGESEESQLAKVGTGEGPLEELSREETIDSVRRAVLSLPEHYREVVILCDLQEMSYAEAATVLGCAVGTVRSRLHRARVLLIEKLRPANEESAAEAAAGSARCFA